MGKAGDFGVRLFPQLFISSFPRGSRHGGLHKTAVMH